MLSSIGQRGVLSSPQGVPSSQGMKSSSQGVFSAIGNRGVLSLPQGVFSAIDRGVCCLLLAIEACFLHYQAYCLLLIIGV